MVLYAALLVCAGLACLLVLRYDMYEKEPWYMIVLTAAIGAGVMLLVGEAEAFSLELYGPEPIPAVYVSAVAATHEELARLLIVVGLAVLVPRQFNDPMDGIIYGSIVGVGMALNESVSFLSFRGAPGGALPPTEVIRVFGHLVMGGITGFAIGMARMRMQRWARTLLGCLAVSMTLHFLWDCVAFAAQETGAMTWWQTAAGVAIMLAGMLFYGWLVVIGSDWSRRVFAPQHPKTLWSWPFSLLTSHGREKS